MKLQGFDISLCQAASLDEVSVLYKLVTFTSDVGGCLEHQEFPIACVQKIEARVPVSESPVRMERFSEATGLSPRVGKLDARNRCQVFGKVLCEVWAFSEGLAAQCPPKFIQNLPRSIQV